MIQDQSIQSQQPIYEQVQVINTSDRPVCITGLDTYLGNTSTAPILIKQQAQTYQPQIQKCINQLNQKIFLITSPTTTAVTSNHRVFQATPTKRAYNLTSRRPITTATRRIIHVPFLPRSPSTVPVVKQSSPIKIVSVKTAQPETHSSAYLTQTPKATTLIDDGFSLHSCSPYTKRSETIVSPNSQVATTLSQPKKTLASMAGIQLTGSVESPTEAMSGAMPTATVEEINVPVFINEYLQQFAYSPSNGDDHSNSNNSKSSQGSENNDLCIEDSIDINNCIDNDIFENFEFDIGLITSDNNTNSGDNFNLQEEGEEEHQEQQQQLKEIMFSNDCYNNNYFNDDKNIEDISMIHHLQDFNCDSSMAISKTEIKDESDDIVSNLLGNPHQYLPWRDSEEMLLSEDLNDDYGSISMHSSLIENAIDITPLTQENELSLSQIMISSQNNPMFSGTAAINSQTLFNAEPIVPDYTVDSLYDDNIKVEVIDDIDTSNVDCGNEHLRAESGAVKRMHTSSNSNNKTVMREKRRKLRLETPICCNENIGDLNTPGVIDLIDQMGTDKNFNMPFRNTKEIVCELLNCSNSSYQSVKAETDTYTPFTILSFDDIEEAEPSTPQSCVSSPYTNQTHTITYPNSPALSTISTSTQGNSITKSRRGRPPKSHSDRPDPEQLEKLSESERKRVEDRAKNNEASRLSRRKNKEREEAEIMEDLNLSSRNSELQAEYNRLCAKEEKLKSCLEKLVLFAN